MVTLVNLIKQSIAGYEMWRLRNWPISPIDRLLGSGKISEVEETAVFVCYQVLIVIINQGNNESLTNAEAENSHLCVKLSETALEPGTAQQLCDHCHLPPLVFFL